MPRYHFHTLHGRPFPDIEGEELADPAAARRRALRIMAEMLRDGSTGFWDVGPFRLLCVDADGAVVTGLVAGEMPSDDAAGLIQDVERERGRLETVRSI